MSHFDYKLRFIFLLARKLLLDYHATLAPKSAKICETFILIFKHCARLIGASTTIELYQDGRINEPSR